MSLPAWRKRKPHLFPRAARLAISIAVAARHRVRLRRLPGAGLRALPSHPAHRLSWPRRALAAELAGRRRHPDRPQRPLRCEHPRCRRALPARRAPGPRHRHGQRPHRRDAARLGAGPPRDHTPGDRASTQHRGPRRRRRRHHQPGAAPGHARRRCPDPADMADRRRHPHRRGRQLRPGHQDQRDQVPERRLAEPAQRDGRRQDRQHPPVLGAGPPARITQRPRLHPDDHERRRATPTAGSSRSSPRASSSSRRSGPRTRASTSAPSATPAAPRRPRSRSPRAPSCRRASPASAPTRR